MSDYGVVFKMLLDDIVDSEKLVKEACKIQETNPDLASEVASEAEVRLNHFDKWHKVIQNHLSEVNADYNMSCFESEAHDYFQNKYRKIRNKIDKLK